MNEVIEFLWKIEKYKLFLLNISICGVIACYCIIKVAHYRSFLNSKLNNKNTNTVFVLITSVFFVLSFMMLETFMAFLLSYIVIFQLYRKIYDLNLKQIIFLASDFVILILLCGAITPAIFSIIQDIPMNVLLHPWVAAMETLAAFLMAVLITYFYNVRYIKNHDWKELIRSESHLNAIICFQGILMFIGLLSTGVYNFAVVKIISYYQLFLMATLIIVYMLLLMHMARSSYAEVYKLHSETMRIQLKNQVNIYSLAEERNIELRKFKHDFDAMISVLKHLIRSGDLGDVESYLHKMEYKQDDIKFVNKKFSNHFIVQSILNDAYIRAIENSISFEGTVYLPERNGLDDLEICRMFSNIIENAIEACLKVEKKARQITFWSNVKNDWFVLEFENSFNGDVNIHKGELISSKTEWEWHGFGTKILREMVYEHKGIIKYKGENDKFRVTLSIPLLKES